MKRGLLMRRIAAAVLITFAALTAMAFVPLLNGLRFQDLTRTGSGVFASQVDTLIVRRPVRLSTAPDVVLKTAMIIANAGAAAGGRTLKLVGPVFEVALADGVAPPSPVTEAARQLIAPLADQMGITGFDQITLQGGRVELKWGQGETLAITGVDAKIQIKSKTAYAATGQFFYHGQPVVFDATSTLAPADATSDRRGTIPWTLRLKLTSAILDANFDGRVELGGALRLSAATSMRTPDASKLADWFGFGWRAHGVGPAMQINGPARWSDGVLTFGKSQVMLNDQVGTGAVSLHIRDQRPLIEATLAFSALDAAPFLSGDRTAADAHAPGAAVWPSVTMDFPAIAVFDADWRLSAKRLQWRGEPIGSAAVSVSARDGILQADFAELELGPHRGTLQLTSNGTGAVPAVSVRGQFQTADTGPLLARMFGAPIISGAAAHQFEFAGRGVTWGDIARTARGRGSVEITGGVMLADLAALQNKVQTAGRAGSGWGRVTAQTAFSNFAMQWQINQGLLTIDKGQVRSGGLAAVVGGHIGTPFGAAVPALDLLVQVGPAASVTSRVSAAGTRSSATGLARALGPATLADVVAISGPWDRPVFSKPALDFVP